ncbi:MAG: MutS-related protein, partial [Terriglobia bacterium]
MRGPLDEYKQRLESCNRAIAEKQRIHLRYGNTKLAVIVAGLTVAWLAIYPRLLSPFWLLAPAATYIAIAVLHNRINRARRRAERLATFYGRGLARIEDRWSGSGETGERFRSAKSIYAEDLDVFGPASLFQLLSTARTTMGENCLAKWLHGPSARSDILERHELLQELREKLDFREQLALAGEDLRAELDPGVLADWAEDPSPGIEPAMRWLFAALAAGAAVTVIILAAFEVLIPLFAVLMVEIALTAWLWKRAKRAIAGMPSGDQCLLVLAGILEC